MALNRLVRLFSCSRIFLMIVTAVMLLAFSTISYAQSTTTYPGGAQNWTALPWSGGTPPVTNGATYTENLTVGSPTQLGNGDVLTIDISFTLNGNMTVFSSGSNPTIYIPAGVTVLINGNFTDNDNNVNYIVDGNLIVTGTFKGKNNAILGGSGSISGGTLDLGSNPSCSGSCPGLTFSTCSTDPSFCSANVTSGSSYSWNGTTSSNWQVAANWTPTRTSPGTSDVLTFPGSGSNKNITNIPTQTIGSVFVTGSSTYSFTPSATNNTLTLTKTAGYSLQIDIGSKLSVGVNSGSALNVALPTNGEAVVGGQLDLQNGDFNISSAILTLHSNSTPLTKASGQVTANSSTTIRFGDTGLTTGTITLPNAIFNGAPGIGSLVMNTTSATLGNQSITVGTSSTFTSGVLNTNAAGMIIFSSPTVAAAESNTSYISGYAQMASYNLGTGALDYLGMVIAAGGNVGSITLTRFNGPGAAATFSGKSGIASVWTVSGATSPVTRNVSFKWMSAFDNGSGTALKFQTYRNTGSGYSAIGSLVALSSVGPPRQSVAASTSTLNATFTLSDENNVLPIELISFSAKAKTSSVDVFWKTLTEKNNDFFVLEKMSGNEFKAIAQLPGAGNSLKELSYSVTDEKPNVGTNYYRLKQVDFDGNFSYSNVISSKFDGAKDIDLYPNPIGDSNLNFRLNFEPQNEILVTVTSVTGIEKIRGVIKQSLTDQQLTLNLEPGVYIVKMMSLDFNKVSRIVVR